MNFKTLTITALIALMSTTSTFASYISQGANPVSANYAEGSPSVDFILENAMTGPVQPGYYIWTDNSDHSSWHIRWTDYPLAGGYDMDGFITVTTGNSVATLDFISDENSIDLITYESSRDTRDAFEFTSYINDGWDGIDFTLNPNASFINFSIGGELFANGFNTGTPQTEPGSEFGMASNIFLGADMNTIDVNNAWTNTSGNAEFDISVPEPGLIALFGAGLIGLGFARKVKKS